MKNKKLALGAIVAAASLMLGACSSGGTNDTAGGSADGAKLNLLVPSYSDNTKAEWEGIIKDFEAANKDIKVNLQVESWENINEVVRTAVQNDKAPDILNIDSFTAYASDDLLYPATDIVSEDTLKKFPENFRKNASMKGTQYGLPLIASARALFYNKDIFEKAGIKEPPKTWDELVTAAKAIKAADSEISPYGMPLGKEEAQAETAIWVFGGGGSYAEGDKITIDTPANVEAVKFMQQLIKDGLTQENPGSSQRTPLGNVFFQGKIGMVVGLPPYINMIKEKNPSLNYGIAPIPTKDGSTVTLGVADHLMAFKNDDTKKDAIKKFLDYFYSKDVYAPKFAGPEGFIPTTDDGMDQLKDNPTIKDFIPLIPEAKFYPFTLPAWQGTQAAIQSDIGQIEGDVDVANVLKTIQSAATDAAE